MTWPFAVAGVSRPFAGHEIVRLTSTSALMVAMQVAGTGLTFVFTVLLARLMPPADVGIVWTIWSAMLLFSVLSSLNIGNAAIGEVVRAAQRGDTAGVAGFMRVSRLTILALALPCGVAFILGFALFGPATFAKTAPFVILAAAVLPVVALERTNGALAAALGHPVAGKVAGLLVRPFAIVAGLVVLALTPLAIHAGLVLTVLFGAVLFAAAVQIHLLRPALARFRAATSRSEEWRRWLTAGLLLVPSRTLADNLKNLFVVAAALVLSGGDVARFAIAFSLIVFLNFGIMAVDVVFDPKIAAAICRPDPARRDRLLGMAGTLKLGPVLVAAAVLWVLAEDILSLFGSAYIPAADALGWFVLMPVCRALAGSSVMTLQVSGERAALAMVSVAALALIIASIVAGGLFGGLTAAAAAGSLAYALTQAMLFLVCRARTGINPSPLSSLFSHLSPKFLSSH